MLFWWILEGEFLEVVLIKKRIKVYRSRFLFELDFRVLVFVLLKYKVFFVSDLKLIFVGNCKRVKYILLIVENGSDDVVMEFVVVLNDLGYCDIVKLIDLSDIWYKIGKIVFKESN